MNKDIGTVFHAKYHASSINDRVSAAITLTLYAELLLVIWSAD